MGQATVLSYMKVPPEQTELVIQAVPDQADAAAQAAMELIEQDIRNAEIRLEKKPKRSFLSFLQFSL